MPITRHRFNVFHLPRTDDLQATHSFRAVRVLFSGPFADLNNLYMTVNGEPFGRGVISMQHVQIPAGVEH